MFIANVNFSPTISMRPGGALPDMSIDLRRDSQGFPTMRFTTLSKQKNSASAVSSAAKNVSLYLCHVINAALVLKLKLQT
jgi:hypothetical protein